LAIVRATALSSASVPSVDGSSLCLSLTGAEARRQVRDDQGWPQAPPQHQELLQSRRGQVLLQDAGQGNHGQTFRGT